MELRVSVEQAAASLGELLERVNARGESVIIERDGKAVGQLVAVPPPDSPRRFTTADLADLLDRLPRPDPGFADDLQRIVDEQPVEVPRSQWD